MSHLLVSGSNGFIGSNFLSQIIPSGNYSIRKILRSEYITNNIDISWDLNESLPNEINTVLHFAGLAENDNKIDPSIIYDVNTRLSIHLFNSFLNSKAEKFIFMSSVKAVCESIAGYLTEETMCQPFSEYGKSKYQAECEMQKLFYDYNLSNPNHQKFVFILRPCIIHGPGNKGNLNLLFNLVSKGLPWPLGSFINDRSFCSVDNLIFILKEIIHRNDIPSGIYNVADDESLSTNELIELIANIQNIKPKIWRLPEKLIKTLAFLGDKLNLPLNSERLQKLTSSYLVSNNKIKNAIGKPLPVSSREGLLKTFKSFKNN
jgi:nucleoside-diphosphate-sugar epimerase